MKNLFLFFILLFAGPLVSTSYSGPLELQVKDFDCLEDGKVSVQYTLTNPNDFEYPNVTLGFKIKENEKPIACKEFQTSAPEGSEEKELIIMAPCKTGTSYTLDSQIFYNVKRYIIEEWFSDCTQERQD